MKAGRIVAAGPPGDVISAAVVEEVYGLACEIVPDPISGTPMVVPRGRHHARTMMTPSRS
jgi:iron complex transport system ATP-binding protein